MNIILYNLMLVNFISTIFYILYLIYNKYTKNNIDNILKNLDEDDYDLYKRTKKKHTTIYIFGILIGLIYLILTDKQQVIDKSSIFIKYNQISDVSDIYVK